MRRRRRRGRHRGCIDRSLPRAPTPTDVRARAAHHRRRRCQVLAVVEDERERRFDAARLDGRREPLSAYAADALVNGCTRGGGLDFDETAARHAVGDGDRRVDDDAVRPWPQSTGAPDRPGSAPSRRPSCERPRRPPRRLAARRPPGRVGARRRRRRSQPTHERSVGFCGCAATPSCSRPAGAGRASSPRRSPPIDWPRLPQLDPQRLDRLCGPRQRPRRRRRLESRLRRPASTRTEPSGAVRSDSSTATATLARTARHRDPRGGHTDRCSQAPTRSCARTPSEAVASPEPVPPRPGSRAVGASGAGERVDSQRRRRAAWPGTGHRSGSKRRPGQLSRTSGTSTSTLLLTTTSRCREIARATASPAIAELCRPRRHDDARGHAGCGRSIDCCAAPLVARLRVSRWRRCLRRGRGRPAGAARGGSRT